MRLRSLWASGDDARVIIVPVVREGRLPLFTCQRAALCSADLSSTSAAIKAPLYRGAFAFDLRRCRCV